MMGSIIGFYFVIEAITLMSWVFSYVFVMTGGGPGQATQVTETYIYQEGFTSDLPWLAASAATILLVGDHGDRRCAAADPVWLQPLEGHLMDRAGRLHQACNPDRCSR